MKFKITSVLLLATVAGFLAFTPKADVYKVDITKSTITWLGKKFAGSHNGTINLTSGSLNFNGKKLTDGAFVADMTSIKDADKNGGLERHLKADDFFGVATFPSANFKIKKVEAGSGNIVNITGDLTIKGVTNSLTFPASVTWNADKTVTATALKVMIDRTKYGIKFKSKSVFSDIGDNFIYDDFELNITLVATK